MTREEIQDGAVKAIQKFHRVSLQWATSVGKSLGAIKMLKAICNENSKILLIVAETAHKKNWEEEFHKWNFSLPYTVECYASLKNYTDTEWDCIVFDEAHHLQSELRQDIISTILADNIILLSATLHRDILESIEAIYGKFFISKITIDTAIKNNILPVPIVYTIPVPLDNTVRTEYFEIKRGKMPKADKYEVDYDDFINNRHQYDRNQYNLYIKVHCTEQEKYYYLEDQIEKEFARFQFSGFDERLKYKYLQLCSQRKRFMGEAKTRKAKVLLNKLDEEHTRYICFCTSIKQAEELGTNYIHSKMKNPQEVIDSFNKKEIDSIYAIGMLQEGSNLKDIQAGVIIQLDGVERAFVQKFGRVLRAEEPAQYIFYCTVEGRTTQDERYLSRIIKQDENGKGLDGEYVRRYEI